MDLVYMALAIAFFVSSWGLLTLCDRLMGGES